jgi:hypothetical protein
MACQMHYRDIWNWYWCRTSLLSSASFLRWKTVRLSAWLFQSELQCGYPWLQGISICGVNVYGCPVLRDVVRCLILFKWRVTVSYRLTSFTTALVCSVSGYFRSIKLHPFLSAVSQNPRMWLDDPTATLLCLHYYPCNAHHMFVRGRPSPISPLKTWRDTLLDAIFKIRVEFCIVPCFVCVV